MSEALLKRLSDEVSRCVTRGNKEATHYIAVSRDDYQMLATIASSFKDERFQYSVPRNKLWFCKFEIRFCVLIPTGHPTVRIIRK